MVFGADLILCSLFGGFIFCTCLSNVCNLVHNVDFPGNAYREELDSFPGEDSPIRSVEDVEIIESVEIVYLDSTEKIDAIEKKYSTESCPICLCEWENGEHISITCCKPINHVFHANCLSEWLMRRTYCPMCNNKLITDLVEPPHPYHQDDENQEYSDDEVLP